jgi:hypothetical protein
MTIGMSSVCGSFLQHGGDVEAVHLRHHHVEHDEIGPLAPDFGDGLAAVDARATL